MLRRLGLIVTALAVFGTTALPAEAQSLKVCVVSNDRYTFATPLDLDDPGIAGTGATLSWHEDCATVALPGLIPTTGSDDHLRTGTYIGTCLLGLFQGTGGSAGLTLVLIAGTVYVGVNVNPTFVAAHLHTAIPNQICNESSASPLVLPPPLPPVPLPSGVTVVVTP